MGEGGEEEEGDDGGGEVGEGWWCCYRHCYLLRFWRSRGAILLTGELREREREVVNDSISSWKVLGTSRRWGKEPSSHAISRTYPITISSLTHE